MSRGDRTVGHVCIDLDRAEGGIFLMHGHVYHDVGGWQFLVVSCQESQGLCVILRSVYRLAELGVQQQDFVNSAV